jgi:hypothetical protein
MDNAGWSDYFNTIFYGDGDWLEPLVCLDIVAHELGHGICQSTAGLLYDGESGAINEGLSDIWGACVENWATTGKQTWTCGEDLGFSLRSMSNPNLFNDPDTYQGTFWRDPTNFNDDRGGVHHNSGVINYWFYLLSQGGSGTNALGNYYEVTGIGIEKAANIVYRAECYYLTSSSNFNAFRNASINAATFYGYDSKEVVSVTNAWHAVGVGSKFLPRIIGPKYFCSVGTYSILGLPSNHTVQWTVERTREAYGWESVPTGSKITLTQTYSTDSIILYPSLPELLRISVTIRNPSGNVVNNLTNFMATHGVLSSYVGTLFWSSTDWQNGQSSETTYQSYGNTLYLTPGSTSSIMVDYVDDADNYHVGSVSVASASIDNPYNELSVSYSGNIFSITVANNVQGYGYTGNIGILLQNECGAGANAFQIPFEIVNMYYSIAYPNPASSVLNISMSKDAKSTLSSTNSKIAQQETQYDIKLYNLQGNLLRHITTGEKEVSLNVANLPNGIYSVHIYDNSGNKPEIHRILISH